MIVTRPSGKPSFGEFYQPCKGGGGLRHFRRAIARQAKHAGSKFDSFVETFLRDFCSHDVKKQNPR
jgi:hypothetical protein